jgi:Fe-S-cluster containining protein
MEPPPSCLECGACCFSNLETSIRVTGNDHQRLGAAAEDLVHFVGNRAYMRLVDGHCAALRIERQGRFVCTVYEARPDACRNLERESPQCAGELFTKGARVTQRLIELRKAPLGEPCP